MSVSQATEQNAIINFMGQVYGESKKIDSQMVESSSTLQPTGHTVERVIREQLGRPRQTYIPPTPAELGVAGVGDASQYQPPGDATEPQPGVVIPTPTGPIPEPSITTVAPAQPSDPQDKTLEISLKLDIIIGELQKLNSAFALLVQDDITNSKG